MIFGFYLILCNFILLLNVDFIFNIFGVFIDSFFLYPWFFSIFFLKDTNSLDSAFALFYLTFVSFDFWFIVSIFGGCLESKLILFRVKDFWCGILVKKLRKEFIKIIEKAWLNCPASIVCLGSPNYYYFYITNQETKPKFFSIK